MSAEVYKAFVVVSVCVLLTFVVGLITVSVLFHELAFTNIKNEYLTTQVHNLLHQCDCREGGSHE